MIRGYNQNLYFAQEVNSNQHEIVNISLDPVGAVSMQGDNSRGVKKEIIHTLHGCHLVALEIDNSNVQDESKGQVRNSLFIFDSLQKIHHLWKNKGQKTYQVKIITLPQHNLTHIKFIRWHSLPINQKLFVYDGVNYCIKTGCTWDRRNFRGKFNNEWEHLINQISTDA